VNVRMIWVRMVGCDASYKMSSHNVLALHSVQVLLRLRKSGHIQRLFVVNK